MCIYTKKEQLNMTRYNWNNLKKIDNQYEDICLETVKEYPEALKYVKEQTEEICLEAVKNDGYALQYVKEQTEEICLEAIKTDELVLECVEKQTPKICLAAIKKNGRLIKKVKNKTDKLCFYAFLNDYSLINDKYIQNGIDRFIRNSIENQVFYLKDYKKRRNDYCYLDIDSFQYLKDYLLKENSNNKYIVRAETTISILKEIALSNNELILVDTGNIKDTHRILANRIIKEEDLDKESF